VKFPDNMYEQIYPKGEPTYFTCTNSCNTEIYCSERCRKTAWESYHETLCTGPNLGPSHPFQRLKDLAVKLGRTNFLMIFQIFGMGIQNYKRYNDKDRVFEEFEAFLANQEACEQDTEAVELMKEALIKLTPYYHSGQL